MTAIQMQVILFTAVLPGTIGFVLTALFWQPWRRDEEPGRLAGIGTALAISLGVIAAMVGASGWPGFPPNEMRSMLVYIAAVAGICGAAEAAMRMQTWRGLAVGLAVAISGRMLFSRLAETPSGTVVGVSAVFLILLAVAWSVLRFACQRWVSWFGPLLGVMTATGAAIVLALGGSALYAQYAGAVAAALGGVFLVALWRRDFDFGLGGLSVTLVLVAILLASGYFFSETAGGPALLVMLAPLYAFGWWTMLQKRGATLAHAAAFINAAILIGGAVAWAYQLGMANSASEYGY